MLTLPQKIKIVRLLLGYQQSDMAKLLDSNQGAVAKYESGKSSPRQKVLENIADKTKWPLEWFTGAAPLAGLFPCQVLLPGTDYGNFALTIIKQGLQAALPVFLQEEFPNPSNVFRIMNQAGEFGAYVIEYSAVTSKCVIIFSPPQLGDTISGIITAPYPHVQDISLPPIVDLLKKAWRKPYMGKMADILKLAGIHTEFSLIAVPVSQPASNPPQTVPDEISTNEGEDGQDELEKEAIPEVSVEPAVKNIPQGIEKIPFKPLRRPAFDANTPHTVGTLPNIKKDEVEVGLSFEELQAKATKILGDNGFLSNGVPLIPGTNSIESIKAVKNERLARRE